jgi:uncharacterized protein (TIGR02996 family)
MQDNDAFLQAIHDAPDDDTPRLVYADWLDEHGEPSRAEFIRLQCALANLSDTDASRWALLARERQLLWQHGKGWAGALRRRVQRYAFRRGFVEDITLSADNFLQHGNELFRLAPLRRVRLLEAENRMSVLGASPLLGRLVGLDLRHTGGMDAEYARPLLRSPHLGGLRELCVRGTGLCNGSGIRALADCPGVAGLTTLDVSDYRRDAIIGRRQMRRRRDWRSTQAWEEDRRSRGLNAGVMRALVESPYLTNLCTLRLGGYGEGFTQDALTTLIHSRLLAGLTELDLSVDFFPDPERRHLAEPPNLLQLLGQSPQAAGLHSLRLRRMPNVGTMQTSDSHLTGLTTLELEDHYFHPALTRELAGGMLPNLAVLRLRSCRFALPYQSQQGAFQHFVQAAGLSRLTVLDLRETPCTPEMIRLLVESGGLLKKLRWLSLTNRGGMDSSPIGSDAVQYLAKSPVCAQLVHLDLDNHDLDNAAATALATSPHLSHLASLHLAHNRIGAEGGTALAASRSLAALTFLDLRDNAVPMTVRHRLRQRFGPGVRYGPGRELTERPTPIRRRRGVGEEGTSSLDDNIPF